MRIDIVTPTRGRPERLLEAIASLQDQSHEEWRAYIVDDDLLLDPDHLRDVVRHLATGPALVHRSGWQLFEEEGREIDREPFRLPADPVSLRRGNTILTCGLAWPRTVHDRLGVFDAAVGSYDDWDWILRILAAGPPLVEVPGLGVGYRIHCANASTHRSARRTGAFARFRAKHDVAIEQKDHLTVHRERKGDDSRGWAVDRPGVPERDLRPGA